MVDNKKGERAISVREGERLESRLGLVIGRSVLVTDVDLVLVVVRDVHVAARAVKRRRSRPRGEFGHLVRIVPVGLVATKQRSRDKVRS